MTLVQVEKLKWINWSSCRINENCVIVSRHIISTRPLLTFIFIKLNNGKRYRYLQKFYLVVTAAETKANTIKNHISD